MRRDAFAWVARRRWALWSVTLATLARAQPAAADDPHRSVAVLEFRAGVTSASEVGERIAEALSAETSLNVMGPGEARRRLGGHADAMVARCAGDAACVAEVGAHLPVDEVLLVGLSQLGDLIVAMQRVRVRDAQVVGRIAEPVAPRAELPRPLVLGFLRRLLPPEDFLRYGTLRVRARVDGALVFIDGRPVGQTPLGDQRMSAPRQVTLRVEKPGYAPFSARLEVLPDAVAEVAPELPQATAPAPWYKRWWVWALVGGAAAATATAVAATRGGDDTTPLTLRFPR
jgi:hypothetical protein